MKFFIFAIIAVAVLSGCTPKLANRQLNQEETEWKEYLEEMYPGWKFPGTLPPAVADRTSETGTALNAADDDMLLPAPADADKKDAAVNADANNANNALTADTNENATDKVRYEDYTVEKDDSLSVIAKKVYGNGRKYHRIYKANEDVIKNPNKIYPGMKLRIPRP